MQKEDNALIIACKDIVKSFGNTAVLKGINFSAKRGEIVSIVGASGAGKTTLLQILGTILKPDSGTLTIDNIDVESLDEKELANFRNRKIGFVFQFHHLLPEFTALENVMLPALIGKTMSSADIEKRGRELLSDLGLGNKEKNLPSELSGGEQQRVAIARALINNPPIIFADEPSGNLDSKTREELLSLLVGTREAYGQTIVIVTHDLAIAQKCDRTIELKDGSFI